MITVVLADDDFLVREILRDSIPWDTLGMEVIATVENGTEALSICKEKQPDILFTDIRMPFLSGLDVAVSLKECGSQTKVVFISGIQDFNYAHTALNIHADGYILKPIQLQEITEVLKKIRSSIDLERNREQFFGRMAQQLSESMPLMRESFLHNLLLGFNGDSRELEEKLNYFHLSLAVQEEAVVAVACIDDYTTLTRGREEGYKQFLNFSVKNIVMEIFQNHQAGACISIADNEFVFILNRSYSSEDKMQRIFAEINELLSDFKGISVSIGVGNPVSVLNSIHFSYNNALRALEHRFYTGKGSIIHIGDVTSTRTVEQFGDLKGYTKINQQQRNLLSSVKLGDTEQLTETLNEYFQLLTETKLFSKDYIHSVCTELIISAYKEIYETENDVQDIFPQYITSLQAVLKAETIFEIKLVTLSILEHITGYFKIKYSKRSDLLVSQIKEIVKKHYMENISLADIAGEVYLSPNYICSVFKKETGETITEYLIELRTQAAQEMLRSSKMKIWEIAEKLGYENPHYFSYSFKKYTGHTPQKYREDCEAAAHDNMK